MTALDRRFGPTLRIMQESPHGGERATAEVCLREFARRAGMTLEQAISQHGAPVPALKQVNIFAGFDDWMEQKEPGWKAKQAAERDERTRQRLARRAAILARYGSVDVALAPCAKEQLLREAVKPWREACPAPHQRWTVSVDGYRAFLDRLPERVRAAVAEAYPLPTTLRDAIAEQGYWQARRIEIEDVLGPENCGDDALDLVARIRLGLVDRLVESDLPATSLLDVLARFDLAQASEVDEPEMIKAVHRDLRALVGGGAS